MGSCWETITIKSLISRVLEGAEDLDEVIMVLMTSWLQYLLLFVRKSKQDIKTVESVINQIYKKYLRII